MFQLERFSIMFQSEHISPMFRWEHFAAETGLSCFSLLGFPAAAGGADVVEGDGAGAEENEGEGEGGQSKGEFVSAVAHQSVVEVDLGDGYGQIDADGKSSHAGEQAQQDEQAAKEFSEGREVGGPGRESEAGDELSVVLQSAENFVVSVIDYDGAKSEAHHEERERLQAVEVAHVVPPVERRIDYSSGTEEGSRLSLRKEIAQDGNQAAPYRPWRE